MRHKGLVISMAAVVVVLAIVVAVTASGGKKDDAKASDTSMGNMQMNTQKNTDDSSAKSEATATNQVTIKDFAFGPSKVTVKVGDTVTWTNQDSVRHDVAPDSPSADFTTGELIGKGESYSFTFKKAGTYTYHCNPHPYMKGTVIVTE